MSPRLRIPPFQQLPEEPPGEILFLTPWESNLQKDSEGTHWDYQVDLSFRRGVRLEPGPFRDRLGLSTSARIALLAEWSTDLSTYVRRRGREEVVELTGDEPLDLTLDLPIAGDQTGGELRLHTSAILLRDSDAAPGAAMQPGSILWEQTEKLNLEAPGSRLPVWVVDFNEFPDRLPHPDAGWMVHLLPEALEHPPSIGMQIYLNSSREDFLELVSDEEAASASPLARKMLYLDVGRQLVQRAIMDDSFCDPEHQFPAGSLGASLRVRVAALFSELSLPQIAALALEEPASFETRVQGGLLAKGP